MCFWCRLLLCERHWMFWQFWLAIRFVCHCCVTRIHSHFNCFWCDFSCAVVLFGSSFCFVRFHFIYFVIFFSPSHTLWNFRYKNVLTAVGQNEHTVVNTKTTQHKTYARTTAKKKLNLSPEHCMLHASACVYMWKVTSGGREPRTSSHFISLSLARSLASTIHNNKEREGERNRAHRSSNGEGRNCAIKR